MKIYASIIVSITTRCVLLLCFSWFGATLYSQIIIDEQPEVQSLMRMFTQKGKEETSINGWRIKIISTTDRRAMENAKYAFQRYFPGYAISQAYENPYYSLKVGAFESRMELESLFSRIKRDFPNALPYRDKIVKNELFE